MDREHTFNSEAPESPTCGTLQKLLAFWRKHMRRLIDSGIPQTKTTVWRKKRSLVPGATIEILQPELKKEGEKQGAHSKVLKLHCPRIGNGDDMHRGSQHATECLHSQTGGHCVAKAELQFPYMFLRMTARVGSRLA
jgi:hypothetical protein